MSTTTPWGSPCPVCLSFPCQCRHDTPHVNVYDLTPFYRIADALERIAAALEREEPRP